MHTICVFYSQDAEPQRVHEDLKVCLAPIEYISVFYRRSSSNGVGDESSEVGLLSLVVVYVPRHPQHGFVGRGVDVDLGGLAQQTRPEGPRRARRKDQSRGGRQREEVGEHPVRLLLLGRLPRPRPQLDAQVPEHLAHRADPCLDECGAAGVEEQPERGVVQPAEDIAVEVGSADGVVSAGAPQVHADVVAAEGGGEVAPQGAQVPGPEPLRGVRRPERRIEGHLDGRVAHGVVLEEADELEAARPDVGQQVVEVDRVLPPELGVAVPEPPVARPVPEEEGLLVAESSVGVAVVEQVQLELVPEQPVHQCGADDRVRRKHMGRGELDVDGVHVEGGAEGPRGEVADGVLVQLVAEAVVAQTEHHEPLPGSVAPPLVR